MSNDHEPSFEQQSNDREPSMNSKSKTHFEHEPSLNKAKCDRRHPNQHHFGLDATLDFVSVVLLVNSPKGVRDIEHHYKYVHHQHHVSI